MLQRTQLMLDIQTKQDLQYLASITNRSMSELVREFVAEKVKQEKKKLKKNHKQQMNAVEALLELAKKAKEIDDKYGYEGPTDWSVNHDHYLYGAPKNTPSKSK